MFRPMTHTLSTPIRRLSVSEEETLDALVAFKGRVAQMLGLPEDATAETIEGELAKVAPNGKPPQGAAKLPETVAARRSSVVGTGLHRSWTRRAGGGGR